MASDPIQLHQVTLVHLLMENPCVVPCGEDRRAHRRAMNRQYQRASRARKKAQAARACSRDPADTVSTVSRERKRKTSRPTPSGLHLPPDGAKADGRAARKRKGPQPDAKKAERTYRRAASPCAKARFLLRGPLANGYPQPRRSYDV
jgi:hypothetical protein